MISVMTSSVNPVFFALCLDIISTYELSTSLLHVEISTTTSNILLPISRERPSLGKYLCLNTISIDMNQCIYVHFCLACVASLYVLSISLSIYLNTYLSKYLSIHLSNYLPIYLSTYLSTFLSSYLFTCLISQSPSPTHMHAIPFYIENDMHKFHLARSVVH